ncbi:MAG: IS200/IS605 family transposase [Anaerolineales bacterium]|nr:IS200/IS605 family transposase [Anaerolineales bacterium]
MRASYSRIYIHLIWATWDRLDLIDDKLEPILYSYITKKCRQQNGLLLQIGGTCNHIHLLVKLLPATNIAQFVKNIKGSSSHYIAQIVRVDSFFKWQGGYATISVSPTHLSRISAYIAAQEEHHQMNSCNKDWEFS